MSSLIIRRRCGESVAIGDVRITVLDVVRGKIGLRIEAPPTVPISRQELLTPEGEHPPIYARRRDHGTQTQD
jgi:carbon storage regulator CsrA